ncbi:DNA polymerase III subunit gamma/tau [Candidatus Saccharibacteria bacterium]|nr:DNA polymerase III subunit gamma/tau [Candidatus Saccharibacteria bacterium]
MGRLALYRTYRPQDLNDVVGQGHIVQALEAALKSGRISHAYLLTGPRGVGKTSVARILARRVNQLESTHNIASELDIIEIDAASNRGIDEIRALRDKISTAPSRLTYKVFIIDEVHMLTREAFNALLKTLEEPPAHAIFILATTEAHKLPDTIISRTQRYDFRPVSAADLAEQLTNVARNEKLSIDEAAVSLIAKLARGGFRDALSLLDQLSGYQKEITSSLVAEVAGIGDETTSLEIIRLSIAGSLDESLAKLQSLWQQGAEPSLVVEHMLLLLRDVFITPDPSDKILTRDAVARALHLLSNAARDQRAAPLPQVPLEIALWQLSSAASTLDVAPVGPPATRPAVAAAKPQPRQAETPVNDVSSEALTPDIITTKALSLIKAKNNSLYAVLRSGEPHMEGDTIVVRCRFRFHKERIEEHKNRQLIETVFKAVAGRPVELRVEINDGPNQADSPPAAEDLVASALEILGGEVIE